MHLKRAILILSLGLLVFACGLGAFIVLKNRYGIYGNDWVQRVFAAVIFCIPALTAAYLREKGVWRKPMIAVVVLCVFGLFAVGLLEMYPDRRTGTPQWRRGSFAYFTIGISAIWAFAIPALAIVSIPKLSGWARVPKILTLFSITTMGLITSCWTIGDLDYRYGYEMQEAFSRIFMMALLVAITSVLSTAIVCKLYGQNQIGRMMTTALDVQVTCPRCKLAQTVPAGKSRCSGCKLRFEIKIEEPRCPQCDYLLHRLTEPVCPECGQQLGVDEVVQTKTELSA
jgi:hypothetical protein